MMNAVILPHNTRRILDTVSDGLMVVGQDGVILMVNQAMERLTGYSKDELVGSSCKVLKCDACEQIRSEGGDKWCKLFEVQSVKRRRCLLVRKDGSYVSALKSGCVLTDKNGKLVGAFEAFLDMTEDVKKDQQIAQLTKRLSPDSGFHGIVARTPSMLRLFQLIERTAQSDAPVIIYGETGTGKELAAHAVHEAGRRKDGPFVQFNCAALNESLLESELFGHAKGAFTGAYHHRVGRFEAASGGDIFLDEIGDIPLSTQVKLLRVLETKELERVGDNQPVRADVRVISATNRNLLELVSLGKFRQDLFFRINVLPIHIPPLRERREDIPLLVQTFIREINGKSGKRVNGVSVEAMNLFMEYDWPGNVRELKSALEYAFVTTNSDLIGLHHLAPHLRQSYKEKGPLRKIVGAGTVIDQGNSGIAHEKKALVDALRRCKGNKTEAAKILGVHRMTVWNRMKKYGIQLMAYEDESSAISQEEGS